MSDQESVSATSGDASPPHLEAQTGPTRKIQKPEKMSDFTFSIWPPMQRTRDAVIGRLVETLSAPSVVSKRYGAIPAEEADPVARVIEEEAYAAAVASSSAEDDGVAILQVYSREISKRMLEAVKARAAPRSAADSTATESPVSGPETAIASEDARSET